MIKEELITAITEDLKTELSPSSEADVNALLVKVKNAYREVKRIRNYQPYHKTKEFFVDDDMEGMYDIVRQLALYDYNQIGAEGQSSHDENGTKRAWRRRENITAMVIPFVAVI